MLVVDSAENSAVNSLPAQPYNIIFPPEALLWLAIDLRASRRIAKATYACKAEQVTPASTARENFAISQNHANGQILFDASMEKVLAPELNVHIVAGVKLDGVS